MIDAGYQVVVVDDFSTGFFDLVAPGCILEKGEAGDAIFIDRLFKQYSFAGVMHFASYSIVPESVTHRSGSLH